MTAPNNKHMYAKKDTAPPTQPFSLNLLSNIRPIAKIKRNIPTNEIYILSIEIDNLFTPNL